MYPLFFKKSSIIKFFFILTLFTTCFSFFICCAETPYTSVKIALVHFAAKHKQPENNLAELLKLNRRAAEQGASIILNTEMAVTGYSFNSREDIANYTETDHGKTITAMGKLALEKGVYIGIALAERDPSTEIYYNSAFIIGPKGKVISKYRKIITAEKRWAKPGSPYQDNFADTPWGRIGAAICADSYSGLLIRTMALKEVDLLWIPANWPESGGLNPVPIWRARALENGFYVAACNRTGKDLRMDCTKTISGVFNPVGRPIFRGSSETSRIFYADIPLNEQGRFAGIKRNNKMTQRNIHHYRNVYLRPWLKNLTAYYKLPETGILHVCCYVPQTGHPDIDELTSHIEKHKDNDPSIWILPQTNSSIIDERKLSEISLKYKTGIALSIKDANGSILELLITPQGIQNFNKGRDSESQEYEFPYNILHFGPAAIAMVPARAIEHPELAVSLSKLGADLVIVSENKMTEEDFLLARVKALTGIAVASCASEGAQITGIQDMHFGWDKVDLDHAGVLEFKLDTAKTRKKSFYDDINFELLLSN
ncbi:MAG: carbon-nitrogen hydrolase family protein [Desulfobacteraceae bacterium]|jgi:predicted amidohydrolase